MNRAEDILHALATAKTFARQENGRWRVVGRDRAGDTVVAIVSVTEETVVVVTTF